MAALTDEQRQALAKNGQAMPDGSYPIRNRADLAHAIKAIGRAKNKAATRAWIIQRAKALDAVDLIPASWR